MAANADVSTHAHVKNGDRTGGDAFPFAVHRTPLHGGDVVYLDEGDGPVALFVHVGMWSFVWRDVVLRLRRHVRCVVVEAPASGLNRGRDHEREPTVAIAANAVDAVVNALSLGDLTLVMHDLGGPASLLAAARWPERVRALVAVNTFGWQPSGLLLPSMLRLMGSTPMRVLDVVTGWLPRLTSTRFGIGRHLDRSDRHAFRTAMDRRGRSSFHHYIRSTMSGRTDWSEIERSAEALSDRPMLTVFGARNDPGKFQPEWRARFPHSSSVIVPKGYHFPMCDDPDLVASAVLDLMTASRP